MVPRVCLLLLLVAAFGESAENLYTTVMKNYLEGEGSTNCCGTPGKETRFCSLDSSFFTSSEIRTFIRSLEVNFELDQTGISSFSTEIEDNTGSTGSSEEEDCIFDAECNHYEETRMDFRRLYQETYIGLQKSSYGLANMFNLGAVCLGARGNDTEENTIVIKQSSVDKIKEICGYLVDDIASYSEKFAKVLDLGSDREADIEIFETSHSSDFDKDTLCTDVVNSLDLASGTVLAENILEILQKPLSLYKTFLDYQECLFKGEEGISCSDIMEKVQEEEEGGSTVIVGSSVEATYSVAPDGFDILAYSYRNPEYTSMVGNYIPDTLGRKLSDPEIIAIACISVIVVCVIVGLIIGFSIKRKHKKEKKKAIRRTYYVHN